VDVDLGTLLYDGESVVDLVDYEAGRVAVTSHRVLVLTPGGDGANVRAVERPNVDGVDTAGVGGGRAASTALKAGLVGVVAVVAAPTVAVDVSGDAVASGSVVGLGGLAALFRLLSRLDELLGLFGAAALLVAVAAGGWAVYTRATVVRIGVAGDEDVHLRAADPDAVRSDLETALRRDASASSRPAP
jgi:hypothetical protein